MLHLVANVKTYPRYGKPQLAEHELEQLVYCFPITSTSIGKDSDPTASEICSIQPTMPVIIKPSMMMHA